MKRKLLTIGLISFIIILMLIQSSFAITVLFSATWEIGNTSEWEYDTKTTGETIAASTDWAHHGTYSVKATSNGGGGTETAYSNKTFAAQTELYERSYIKITTSGIDALGDYILFTKFRSTTGQVAGFGWWNSSNVLKWVVYCRNVAAFVYAYGSTPLIDTVYEAELYWSKSVTGKAELYVNDAVMCTATGNTTNYGDVSIIFYGIAETLNCAACTFYGDCLIVSPSKIGLHSNPTLSSSWSTSLSWTMIGKGAYKLAKTFQTGETWNVLPKTTFNDVSSFSTGETWDILPKSIFNVVEDFQESFTWDIIPASTFSLAIPFQTNPSWNILPKIGWNIVTDFQTQYSFTVTLIQGLQHIVDVVWTSPLTWTLQLVKAHPIAGGTSGLFLLLIIGIPFGVVLLTFFAIKRR